MRRVKVCGCALSVCALVALAQTAQATVIVVTTPSDSLEADGLCSLREALQASNGDVEVDTCGRGSGRDTIILSAQTYVVAITGIAENAGLTGDFDLIDDVDIIGASAAVTAVDGMNLDRVFHVQVGASVALSRLTVRNGSVSNTQGGGILNRGLLWLTDVTVFGNVANAFAGGGIGNVGGTLLMRRCAVMDNSAVQGAGINNEDGYVHLLSSTIAANQGTNGAGLANVLFAGGRPTIFIEDSTISGNTGNRQIINGDLGSPGQPTPTIIARGSLIPDYAAVGTAPAVTRGFNATVGFIPFDTDADFVVANNLLAEDSIGLNGVPIHVPTPESPLLGLIPAEQCGAYDQQGLPRSIGGPCTPGAAELHRDLVFRVDEPAECEGLAIAHGLDDGLPSGTANDGVLQDGEIDQTDEICDAIPGEDCVVLDPGSGEVEIRCADGASVFIEPLAPGEDCSVAEGSGDGTGAAITCGGNATVYLREGVDGTACTVDDDGGIATVTCGDVSVELTPPSAGQDGTGCTATEEDGLTTVSCGTASATTTAGSPGTAGDDCVVIGDDDGRPTVSCGGSQAILEPGSDGAPGQAGRSCTVVQAADGSATVTCSDGTEASFEPGEDGTAGGCQVSGGVSPWLFALMAGVWLLRRRALIVLLALAPATASAGALFVTSTSTELIDDGNCGLREAIWAADTDSPRDACPAGSGTDTILVPAGRYELVTGDDEDGNQMDDLDIGSNLNLVASPPGSVVIDGNGSRVLQVHLGSVVLQGFTLTDGMLDNAAGGAAFVNPGCGLTLRQCRIEANSSPVGGGVFADIGSRLVVEQSSFVGNDASAHGGALCTDYATLVVENSTFTENSAPAGSVLSVFARSGTLAFNTLVDNEGPQLEVVEGGVVQIRATAILGGTSLELSGDSVVDSLGYNLLSDAPAAFDHKTDVLNAEVTLSAAPQRHGLTAFYPDSAAVDAVPVGPCPVTDQLGVLRPEGAGCDIGAVELPVGALVFRVSAADECELGGIRVESGHDDGLPSGVAANGLLDDGEVEAAETRVACNGADGADCTVAREGSTATIVCGDGSTAEISDGEDGDSCHATDNEDGTVTIDCDDDTQVILSDGETDACTAEEEDDGSVSIACDDGTTATLAPGADGESCTVEQDGDAAVVSCDGEAVATVEPGPDGAPGEDGTSCTVDEAADGSVTVTCEDGSTVVVAGGSDGAPGADGAGCEVTQTEAGAAITCDDGTSATVADGTDGADGCQVAGGGAAGGLVLIVALALARRRWLALLLATLIAQQAAATVIIVETNEDDDGPWGLCTLRDATRAAMSDTAVNGCPAGSAEDTIVLPSGRYLLTIPGRDENASVTGDLDVQGRLTIVGAGARTTIIDGGGIDRVFDIRQGSVFEMSGVTVTGGYVDVSGQFGGGIVSYLSNTTLLDVAIVNNQAVEGYGSGGGIFVLGDLLMERCTVFGNTARQGSGIAVEQGRLWMINSTISGNFMGGIDPLGAPDLFVLGSGGVPTWARLDHVTIAGTVVDPGLPYAAAVVVGSVDENPARLEIRASIWAAEGQALGAFNPALLLSYGYNIFSDDLEGIEATDVDGVDPLLAPLADTGGSIDTMVPAAGSPAIDRVDVNACAFADQRGVLRPQGAGCDAGAVERVFDLSLYRSREATEDECPNGGTAVDSGLDDGDGVLSDDEVDRTDLACNGADAPSCSLTEEEDGGVTLSCPDDSEVTLVVGEDGTGCTQSEEASTITITCADGSEVELHDGPDGWTCDVTDNDDGSLTIECSGGGSMTLSPGEDGGSCTVSEEAGDLEISCDDGTTATVAAGADGDDGASCSVASTEDGGALISCTDGTEVVIPPAGDGGPGAAGADGAACGGEAGQIACADGSSASVADGADGEGCTQAGGAVGNGGLAIGLLLAIIGIRSRRS